MSQAQNTTPNAKPDVVQREAQPGDIQVGEEQFLRYRGALIRGRCNSAESVVITWSSGFTHSCKADTWNDREFLEQPERARKIGTDEYPQAHAFFFQVNARQTQKRPGMRLRV